RGQPPFQPAHGDIRPASRRRWGRCAEDQGGSQREIRVGWAAASQGGHEPRDQAGHARSQGGAERQVQPERRPMTMAANAYDSAVRTMAILAPELILLLAAIGMLTLSAFLHQPRRQWCRAAVWAILAALAALFWASGKETDLYASAALNDALS